MIRINDKDFNKIEIEDIKKFLIDNEESQFFEFKSNEVQNKKLVEEIVAFSNTYGGYILLGVSDNKEISGCPSWSEERIHTIIHDSISPIPIFDIKKLKDENKIIFVIKIEQGNQPPYITNTGKITERIASGSYVIKDSARLLKLEERRKEFEDRIKRIIEVDEITKIPQNLCCYLDKGFYPIFKNDNTIKDCFEQADIKSIVDKLREERFVVYANRVGNSYVFTFGDISVRDGTTPANLGNFLEIMKNGAIKSRILASHDEGSNRANIANFKLLYICMSKIYMKIFANIFSEQFINAYCYDKLTVLNRFEPYFEIHGSSSSELFEKDYRSQNDRIGKNMVYLSNRFPYDGFYIADTNYLKDNNMEVNSENIINYLFISEYNLLGLIEI